jgi:hypothetical protein
VVVMGDEGTFLMCNRGECTVYTVQYSSYVGLSCAMHPLLLVPCLILFFLYHKFFPSNKIARDPLCLYLLCLPTGSGEQRDPPGTSIGEPGTSDQMVSFPPCHKNK